MLSSLNIHIDNVTFISSLLIQKSNKVMIERPYSFDLDSVHTKYGSRLTRPLALHEIYDSDIVPERYI